MKKLKSILSMNEKRRNTLERYRLFAIQRIKDTMKSFEDDDVDLSYWESEILALELAEYNELTEHAVDHLLEHAINNSNKLFPDN